MQAHADDLRVEIENDWAFLTIDHDDAEHAPVSPDNADAAIAAPTSADLDAFTHNAVRDWRSLPVTPAVMALLEYAEKITKSPAACTQADVDRLRKVNWSDSAIHDAVQIVSYFNYINRIADALGVEPEAECRNWGSA